MKRTYDDLQLPVHGARYDMTLVAAAMTPKNMYDEREVFRVAGKIDRGDLKGKKFTVDFSSENRPDFRAFAAACELPADATVVVSAQAGLYRQRFSAAVHIRPFVWNETDERYDEVETIPAGNVRCRIRYTLTGFGPPAAAPDILFTASFRERRRLVEESFSVTH